MAKRYLVAVCKTQFPRGMKFCFLCSALNIFLMAQLLRLKRRRRKWLEKQLKSAKLSARLTVAIDRENYVVILA